MSEYSKLLPVVTPEGRPFWANLKQHKLTIQRCLSCGRYRHYPSLLCPECHSADVEWAEVGGRGHVYTFSISMRAFHPGFAADVPYATVTVQLDEGPRIVSRVIDVPPEEIEIGMPVQVVFKDVTEQFTLPFFKRAK